MGRRIAFLKRVELAVLVVGLSAQAGAQQSTFNDCLRSVEAADAFMTIRGKLALAGASQTTFAMLTDKSSVTDDEKAAIAIWAEAYAKCHQLDAPYRRGVPPDAAALMEGASSRVIALAAQLYSSEITYADFNRARSEVAQRAREGIASIVQRERTRAHAAESADYEQRRALALQYLLGRQPTYQPPATAPYQIPRSQIPRSTVTDCYQFGTQTTCTTR